MRKQKLLRPVLLSLTLTLVIMSLFAISPALAQGPINTSGIDPQQIEPGQTPDGLTPTEWESIQTQITAAKYRPYAVDSGGFAASNLAHGWQINYGSNDNAAEATDSTPVANQEGLLQFTSQGHVVGFSAEAAYLAGLGHALRVGFVDANRVTPQAGGSAAGSFADKAPASLNSVTYYNLWDGVNLTYEDGGGVIAKSTYHVAVGADPAQIRLAYNAPVEVQADGSLVMHFEKGVMTESAPVAWQEIAGRRVPVRVAFTVYEQTVTFNVGGYDPAYPLTIDPSYTWHTFYGSTGWDYGNAIALDSSGNIYVAGRSNATWNSGNDDAPLHGYSGGYDIVVLKLDSTGAYQWHTFYGSSTQTDNADAIAIDSNDNVYVAGNSYATWRGPNSESPKNAYTSGADLFLLKLNSDGAYQWHTFYGGSSDDFAKGVAIDSNNNVYVTGYSLAAWNETGLTPNNAFVGDQNLFALKLDSAGVYQWHTFYGPEASGTNKAEGNGIAIDSDNNVYIVGSGIGAWLGDGNAAPLHPYTGSAIEILVLKLNSDGAYQWHTFYGSDGGDNAYSITIDDSNNLYVSGASNKTWLGDGDTNPKNDVAGTSFNIAVLKLSSAGAYQWHTFHGGTSRAYGYGITLDSNGNLYVTGQSQTSSWTGPANEEPLHPFLSGIDNATTVLALKSTGEYDWHTFYGDYSATGIVNSGDTVYVAGYTYNSWQGDDDTDPLHPFTGADSTAFDIMVMAYDVTPDIPTCTPNPTTGNWSVVFAGCPGGPYLLPSGSNVTLDITLELTSNLTVESGATLDATTNKKTVTLKGGDGQTLTGDLEFYRLTVNKDNKTDEVTVNGSLKVKSKLRVRKGVLNSASDYGDVDINYNGTMVLTNTISLSGSLAVSGTLTTNGHAIIFDGGVGGTETVAQSLWVSDTLTAAFADIAVYTNTLLVETNPNDMINATNFTGVITNYGTIRKSQPMESGDPLTQYYFGLAGYHPDVNAYGLELDITDLTGSDPLTAIQIDRIDQPHPNAPPGAGENIYWTITPTGTDFIADVILPHNDLSTPLACRYSGSAWVCANDDSDTDYVTYADATAFSDWAVFSCAPSMTVTDAGDDGSGSLRQAVASVCPGGVIDFDASLYGSVITLTSGEIAITKALTIDGPGADQVAVSGNNASRIFNITDTVTIDGLTLRDGSAADAGGAIFTTAALTLTQVSVVSNTAATYGGGIGVTGALVISGSQFISNTSNGVDTDYNGVTGAGAVYARDNVTLVNSLFQQNRALTPDSSDADVGALYVSGSLTVTRTDFISNTAVDDTGAIWVETDVRMVDCLLQGNEATGGYGGALDVDGTLVVSGTQFIGNISNGDDTYGTGAGAIYAADDVMIINSLFQENEANNGYNAGAFYTWDSVVTITNTDFISNTAGGNDGAIFVEASSGTPTITISGGEFRGNQAEGGYAGALEAGGALVISGTDFISNTSSSADGAIYASVGANITNSLFQGNEAGSYAGALDVDGTLVVSGTDFIGNVSNGDDTYGTGAGAIYARGDATLVNSLFQQNQALNGYNAGVLYTWDSVVTITNTNFISNTAGGSAGAIFVEDYGGGPPELYITDSRFQGNRAQQNYGAIQSEGPTTIVNSLLAGNHVGSGSGAAVYVDAAGNTSTLLHTTIASATPGSDSSIEVAAGTLDITNSIIANYATGIKTSSGTVNEDYNLFAGNTTDRTGVTPGANSLSGTFADVDFVDAAGGDFHLTSSSWALNKGTNAGLSTDIDGDARPGGGGYDLGFDETTYTGPTATDDTATTTIDKAITLSPLTNDTKTDGDDLTIGAVGDPANGTATISGDSQIVFTPTTGYSGTVVFTYTAREASQLEDTATITVTVDEISDIYLPLIVKNYRPLPDLVIPGLTVNGNNITVTVQNNGDKTVVNDFWVDVYFNPDDEPALNDRWDSIGSDAGAVWGVTANIGAGDSLTLTVGDAYYRADLSSSTFPGGAKVYGLVDSVNHNTNYGNVEESNEGNNLWPDSGPVGVQAAGGGGVSMPGLPNR